MSLYQQNQILNDSSTTNHIITTLTSNQNMIVDGSGNITTSATPIGGVTSVTGTAPIVSSGGSTPAISLANTAVTPGSYTLSSITVDAKGRLTAASSGTALTVGTISTTPTANAADITGTVLTMHNGGSSAAGVGNIQTHAGAKCAVGNGCFPQYSGAAVGTNITAMGQSGYGTAGLVTNSANNNSSFGTNSMNQVTTANETTCIGYYTGNALTTGGYGTYVGSQSGRQITTSSYNAALGYQTLYTGTSAANCTAVGTFSGNVTTGSGNTFCGYQAGLVVTSGATNCGLGSGALSNGTTGSNNLCLGANTTLSVATDSSEIVIGSGTVGNGSNTTTIGAGYIRAVAGGNALSQNAATGEITRAVSSLRYKTVIDQNPPVSQFTNYLFQLQPRGVTMNNDPEKIPRITYIAEEVEKIVGPMGNPVFSSLLVYADMPDPLLPKTTISKTKKVFNETTQVFDDVEVQELVDTRRRMVDGINYAGFVVPIIELLKQQQATIDKLSSRLAAAGIP